MRLPTGLKALTMVAKQVGWDLRGAYVNRDGGFASKPHRQVICNAGMIANSTEHPRHRKTPKRGRQQLCNEAIPT